MDCLEKEWVGLKIRRYLVPWGFDSPSRHHDSKEVEQVSSNHDCTMNGAGVSKVCGFEFRVVGLPLSEANLHWAAMFRKEMEFERAFMQRGVLLLAGSDAVFNGVIAGFGDHRELELLVEAGFTPEEAVQTYTLNGARFLKQDTRIGSLAAGKLADIAIVKGDLAADIKNIENVEMVFKDGVGYDSKKANRVGKETGRTSVSTYSFWKRRSRAIA
jgi:imidazolonepropionase-like amidohydrolase